MDQPFATESRAPSEALNPHVEPRAELPVNTDITFRAKVAGWLKGLRFRQVLAIPFWLLSFALFTVSDVLPQLLPLSQFMNASRMGTLLDLAGVVCMVLAARLGASTATQLFALQPRRRPVLYLRSFKADKNPVSTSADEEVLSRIFRTIGPFVAFEEPGERLPEIGSAKLSAANSDWQQAVTDHIRQAELVVLNMGSTPAFMWEVQRVLEVADPERILVYLSVNAEEHEMRMMFRSFVAATRELIPEPFPPETEIGTRRFIRFDADRRPELFGEIERPKTTWRRVVGVLSLGMGLVVLRPIVAERLRNKLSTALAPMRARFDKSGTSRRLWGRLAVAAGVYWAGLVAFLPMLAWNAWHSGNRRTAVISLACLPLVALGPVNDVTSYFSMAFAVIVYLAWPVVMPRDARRYIALGGPVFGVGGVVLAIFLASAPAAFLPHGIPQRVSDAERAAVIDIEALRSQLPGALTSLGANPTHNRTSKQSNLDGSFALTNRYESPDLFLESSVSQEGSPIVAELVQLGSDFPGFEARRAGGYSYESWRITTYDLAAGGQPSGVGAIARRGRVQYRLILSGLTMPSEEVNALLQPHLDAATRVRGLIPTLGR